MKFDVIRVAAYYSPMVQDSVNLVVILGPTASGKTRLGVRVAHAYGGEIVSADSRQVYRGLDIGAGKDLAEYDIDGARVPYHLIDICDLDEEFSVFAYQQRFYTVFEDLAARNVLPVVVGGTGLYIEAVLKDYRMVEVPENPELRAALASKPMEDLAARLLELKGRVHNVSDLRDRDRLIRAIEIAEFSQAHEPPPAPDIRPLILGTRWPRQELRRRLRERLAVRLAHGLIEEVEGLLAKGTAWDKLDFLGLEYRYVASFLRGEMRSRTELFDKLAIAIGQFAKRQETWFRRMERRGFTIHWIDRADFRAASPILEHALGKPIREG